MNSAEDRIPCPDGKCIIQQEKDPVLDGVWFTHGLHWPESADIPMEHRLFIPGFPHSIGAQESYELYAAWLDACHRSPAEVVNSAISGEFDEEAERARLMPV